MAIDAATIVLVNHLKDVLNRLEKENHQPECSCCACLQDVAKVGHLPSCYLAGALKMIEHWKDGC